MDAFSEARLSLVHPALAAKIRTLAEMLAQENIVICVTQGLRTWQEQAALYAQGRTVPGQVVTNAPPGHSHHQFGLACDLAPFGDDGKLDWNAEHPVWKRMVDVGVSLGLTAGANFHSIKDRPHFQLTGVLPVSPDDRTRELFTSGGIQAVWDATQLA